MGGRTVGGKAAVATEPLSTEVGQVASIGWSWKGTRQKEAGKSLSPTDGHPDGHPDGHCDPGAGAAVGDVPREVVEKSLHPFLKSTARVANPNVWTKCKCIVTSCTENQNKEQGAYVSFREMSFISQAE